MAGKQWGELLQSAEAGPEPIPDGIYDFVVHTAKFQAAKNGTPMIVAVLKVVSGPYAGKTVWNNFVLSDDNPNALGWFFKHMAAMGIDQGAIANLPPPEAGGMEQLAQMVLGKYLTASIGHELYRGATKNRVGDIKPYSGQPGAPMQAPQPQFQPQFTPQPQPAPQFAQQQGAPQQPYQQPQYAPQPQVAPPAPQQWQPQQPQVAPGAFAPPQQPYVPPAQPQQAQQVQQQVQEPQPAQVVQFPPQDQTGPQAPPPPPF